MTTYNLTFNDLPEIVGNLAYEISELKKMIAAQPMEQPTEQPERLLTIQEAAKFLHLAVPTIYSKVSRNELPFMKRGKRLYFSSIDLMDYVKDGRRKTTTEIETEAQNYLRINKKGR